MATADLTRMRSDIGLGAAAFKGKWTVLLGLYVLLFYALIAYCGTRNFFIGKTGFVLWSHLLHPMMMPS